MRTEIRASCLIQRRRQEMLRGVASRSKDCLNAQEKLSTDDPADVCTRPRGRRNSRHSTEFAA